MGQNARKGPVRRGSDWLAHHAFVANLGWIVILGVLISLAEINDWNIWTWMFLLSLLVVPSLTASIIVLSATPRRHYDNMSSVFGHFFTRYLALVFAFFAWSASVVIGAVISTVIQEEANNEPGGVLEAGSIILGAIVPGVVAFLWVIFLLRCAWFLARVRGWSANPTETRVPDRLFRRHPTIRTMTIGLAHPGLLVLTGVISTFGIFAVDFVNELTIDVNAASLF